MATINRGDIYGTYNRLGYSIYHRQPDGSDKQLYNAGNSRFDSGQTFDTDDISQVCTERELKTMCAQTIMDLGKEIDGATLGPIIFDPIGS